MTAVQTSAASPPDGTVGLAVRGGVTSVYQPIVDLASGQIVAYEALARGDRHLKGLPPAELFARARRAGVEEQLDWECRAAAFAGALQARLPAQIPLFVNVEPRWLASPCPAEIQATLDLATSRLQIIVEITERALVADPAGLLSAVRAIRDRGWGIALDDVGAVPESLALMPFIEPDVIKLDLRLVQTRTNLEISAISNAVTAQAERTGAIVLAEGIETEQHFRRAQVLGATLGQGWVLGRPAPLPLHPRAPSNLSLEFTRPQPVHLLTPFHGVETHAGLRAATKDLLLPMSQFLESHALTAAEPPVVLAAFEHVDHFTPRTAERYARLVPHCSFVAVLGAGMAGMPVPGVRGADLPHDDALRGEWVVATVGPHFAGALIAKDLYEDRGAAALPDRDRRFIFAITHDRNLVLRAARSLLARVSPQGEEQPPSDGEGPSPSS